MKEFPADKQSHNLVNKLSERRVFTEEKLDDTGARFKHTPRKSPKRLAQETECQSLVQERQHNC
jgi:hypothetical protein